MARSRFTDRDLGWKKIKREITKMDKGSVLVGILSDAGIHKGGKEEGESSKQASYAKIATVHEYGFKPKNIPSRPFLRQTAENKSTSLRSFLDKLVLKIYDGHATTKDALNLLGLKYQGWVKKEITRGNFENLKASTIRRRKRGSSKPLIDTGLLRKKIDYEVKGV